MKPVYMALGLDIKKKEVHVLALTPSLEDAEAESKTLPGSPTKVISFMEPDVGLTMFRWFESWGLPDPGGIVRQIGRDVGKMMKDMKPPSKEL